MENFRFEEEGHTYWLDDKRLTGVTTILGVIAKPALINWSARTAVEYIRKHKDRFARSEFSEIHFEQVCKEAVKAHERNKLDAADVGTVAHKAVEQWIKTKKQPKLEGKAKHIFDNFKLMVKEEKIKFLESERSIYSRKYWYAGTYDFLCDIGGELYLGDLKTSNGIYGREYFAQMAGYEICRREHGEPPVKGFVVIRSGKNLTHEVRYSHDIETDTKLFLAALEMYRALQTWK